MSESHHGRTREPGAVPGAGMRELVGQDQVVLAHECGDDAEARQVSAAEDDGALGALQLRQQPLELGIRRVAAGDQPRRAGAGAVALEGLARAAITAGWWASPR